DRAYLVCSQSNGCNAAAVQSISACRLRALFSPAGYEGDFACRLRALVLLVHPAAHARGSTHHDCAGRHILGDHRRGRHHGVVTDGHPWQDGDVRAEPHVVAYPDGCRVHIGPAARVGVMVQRGENGIAPDQGVVADGDATLVLELAAGVDEDTG